MKFDPLAQLKRFLEPTEGQVQQILANNDEYNRWYFDKLRRIADLGVETAKQVLDPLGARRAIRRIGIDLPGNSGQGGARAHAERRGFERGTEGQARSLTRAGRHSAEA